MKFLVDAQLPIHLVRLLQEAGYDTIHTKELPQQSATPDSIINFVSIQEERVVITKDSDFVDSFLTVQQPYKLLLINSTRQPLSQSVFEAPINLSPSTTLSSNLIRQTPVQKFFKARHSLRSTALFRSR
ncbi:MAG: DUF5615 family PIN-like protein [Elainella sp.]